MTGFRLRADGGSSLPMVANPDEIRQAIKLFSDPVNGFELMALKSGIHRTYLGSELDKLCDAVSTMPGGIGIYFRINPVKSVNKPANNPDVVSRRWLYIDVDPVKPEGETDNPATDDEKSRTSQICDQVNEYLTPFGWPTPVIVDSGNGYGLYYRCDLSNDKLTQATYRTLLALLATKFNGPNGHIDKSVHNANRLGKLPGTWARKGKASADRPHRPCKIHYVPDTIEIVTAQQLAAAAGTSDPITPKPLPNYTFPSTNGKHDSAPYGRKALDAECARVVLARSIGEGANNALNRAAFSLGQLVAGGVLLEEIVISRLYDAAMQAGLGERETRLTIHSGLVAGKATPRGVPESKDPKAKFENGKSAHTEKQEATSEGEQWSITIDGEVIEEGLPKQFLPKQETKDGGRFRAFELYSFGGLMQTVFPEPKWAINGILSEGLNILGGKPKMGKSMMAMNLAMTVAAGGMALGNMQTSIGDVLYISLEDRSRRIQARARKMLKGIGCNGSNRLTLATTWPRQGEGGLEMVEWWMKRVSRPGLVIIDVWGKFRPPSNAKANAYTQDYEHMSPLKDLMDKYSCCGLALMHLRKGASEDVVEDVSGTLGIAGAADGIMVLTRARNDNEAKIFVTGRDVADSELALRFDPDTLVWTNLGEASEHVSGKMQIAILKYLGTLNGESAFASDIAKTINATTDGIRPILHRLFEKRLVRRVGKAWAVPGDDEPAKDEHWSR